MAAEEVMIPRTVTVDGREVTYYDSEDTRNHPDDVLVLIHGTGGNTAAHFGFLFPVLASRQRVVAIDWAQISEDKDLELDDLVNQCRGAIDRILPGKKIALLGYSLGAVVAAKIAADAPDLVERLLLVCGWARTDQQQQLRNSVWQALRQAPDDRALREYSVFCTLGGPYLSFATPDQIEAGLGVFVFNSFIDQQMELNRHIDIAADVEKIQARTLVVGCTHDIMVPIRHQKALFGAIPDARFAEIGTGHGVVIERPSELSHHIQEFMDTPDKYAAGDIIPAPRP